MAFVMIAGPQILSAIFLATSQHWQRNTAAYLAGAALSITLVVSLAYLLSPGAPREGGSNQTVNVIVLVLLLAAMVHVFLARKQSEPPKWMGKLETASPRLAFSLGFMLLGVFPTDILTSVAVGAFLSSHGDPWWHLLPFLGLTLLFLALPVLLVLAFGKRDGPSFPRRATG
jgi:Sap, sulfolipid-1-addressing protein